MEHETLNATKKLRNKMIKSSVKILLKGYHKLFNLILEGGCFPDQWCERLITPIFTAGDKNDPNNYSGTCVTSNVGKFFRMILNQPLDTFSQENNLIHPSQNGFIPGHRTADDIFTLKTLLGKQLSQNRNEKVYACFGDFEKAFDSVWHERLFFKLLKNKIGGNFYSLIRSLYSNSKCAIKQAKTRTPFFSYSKGVCQGCILSLLLFNIYIYIYIYIYAYI